MEKAKVLMLGLVLVFIVGVVALASDELKSSNRNQGGEETSYLRISSVAYCTNDSADVRFSKNPPYFVGEKYYWWIRITISADANVSDVVFYDQLGEEFMIEGMSFVPIEKPGPYNYTFEYDAYESDAYGSVTDGSSSWCCYLNETGVRFDGFLVYWADKSLKANFQWNIGFMDEGEVKEIFLTISTDTNPAGLQEFTSSGNYFLNLDATVWGTVESTDKQVSAQSANIKIEVLQKTE